MNTTRLAGRSWATRNKSDWGPGPWQEEPDKVQWVDGATGLDCLAVRGPIGSWCGYVGVPETHRFFGKHYDGVPVDVHGGLTFSEACQEASPERFEKWKASMIARKPEAARFPVGDSARAWRDKGHLMDNYEAWHEAVSAESVCHIPEAGRPDKVWWLGFDCAHIGDASPGSRVHRQFAPEDTYKTIEYVQRECRSLAAQLA